MGRWAQRRRTGAGSGQTSQVLINLVSASLSGGAVAIGTWNAPVSEPDFDPSDFVSSPSNEFGTSLSQSGANGIEVTFSGDVSTDTDFQYTGNTPGVLTPDTVAYS
jgi:hypothetical protein